MLNLLQKGLGTLWHFGIWKIRNQGLEKKQGKCKATTVKVTRTNQGKIKVFTFLLYYSMHLRAEGEHQATDIYFDTESSDQYLKKCMVAVSGVTSQQNQVCRDTFCHCDWRSLYQSLLRSWGINSFKDCEKSMKRPKETTFQTRHCYEQDKTTAVNFSLGPGQGTAVTAPREKTARHTDLKHLSGISCTKLRVYLIPQNTSGKEPAAHK